MTSQCPFTDQERKDEVVSIIRDELSDCLDKYFKTSPFAISMQQHYDDHAKLSAVLPKLPLYEDNQRWISEFRADVKTVKRSFLAKLGTIIAVFIAGGFTIPVIIKYFSK